MGRVPVLCVALSVTAFAALPGASALAQQTRKPDASAHGQAREGRTGSRPTGPKQSLSQVQIENVKQRIAIATGLISALEPQAKAQGLANGWRQATLESLLSLRLENLERVGHAQTTEELSRAMAAETIAAADVGPLALGSTTEDLVYKPIPPCRYIDTRNIGGVIHGFRGYDLVLPGSNYGGSAACDPQSLFGVLENEFGALAMNVTVLCPVAAPGFVAVKPTQSAPVTSLVNWYETGPTVQVANQGIFTMDQSGLINEFTIQPSDPAHVLVDIFGAFIAPHASELDQQVAFTEFIASSGSTFSELVSCPAGYRLTGGGAGQNGTSTGLQWWQLAPHAVGTTTSLSTFRCRGYNSGISTSVTCYAICARIPGR